MKRCNENPTPIATGGTRPYRIVLNASSVFWTDNGDDNGNGAAVLMLPK